MRLELFKVGVAIELVNAESTLSLTRILEWSLFGQIFEHETSSRIILSKKEKSLVGVYKNLI